MFFLLPRSPLARPQRGSPRMFRVEFVERYLSRVRPWQVVALWAPVTVACVIYAVRDRTLGATEAVLLGMAGLLAWTLLEYVLHRWVFHFPVSERSELQRDLGFMLHQVHHDYPWDADRLVMPPLVSVLLGLLLQQLFWHLLGPHYFFPFFAGLVAGYLWYDLSHYYFHHGKPRSALGRYLRSHHLVHHFGPHGQRYGVSSPLWDVIFGTMPSERRATDPAQPAERRA